MARARMQITGKGHYKWKSPKCLSYSDREEVHLNAIKHKMDKKNVFLFQQNFFQNPFKHDLLLDFILTEENKIWKSSIHIYDNKKKL